MAKGKNGGTRVTNRELDELKLKKEQLKGLIFHSDPKVAAKNKSQEELGHSIKNNHITICGGLAGNGKTFISIGHALSLLKKETSNYTKIYIVKSVTQIRGEELGYIKGNIDEKVAPFIKSFEINAKKIIRDDEFDALMEHGFIEFLPIAFIRGLTIDNAIIIVDEAQNLTMDIIKTLLTRISYTSKMIIIGDSNQIDLKNKEESCLDNLFTIFENLDDVGLIKMDEDENVRNPLINTIEKRFKEFEENNKNKNSSQNNDLSWRKILKD